MRLIHIFIALLATTVLASKVEVSLTIPDKLIWADDEPVEVPSKEDCDPDDEAILLGDFNEAIKMATRARDMLDDPNRPAHVTSLFNVLFKDNGVVADLVKVAGECGQSTESFVC
jgi:hypothetical protein